MRVLLALFPCVLQASPLTSVSNTTVEGRWSSSYEVQLELATRHIASVDELEQRLADVVAEALKAAAAKHFRQTTATTADLAWGSNISVKVTKRLQDNDAMFVSFVTFVNEMPVSGEVISDDLQLLSAAHISAALHYPFSRAVSHRELSNEAQSRWWIIVLVFGVGLLLLLFGWFILFVYYNSCGRPGAPALALTKTVYVKDEETQSSPKEDEYRAAIEERGTSRTATRDAQESPPLEATDQREEKPSEEKSSEKESPQRREGRSPNPPPPLKLPTSSSPLEDSKPLDSWGADNEFKRFDFKEAELPEKSRTERPKAAGKTRPLRTAEGKIVGSVPSSTGWYVYDAGDVAAHQFGVSPSISWASSNDHPHPSRPTSMGTVHFDSNFNNDAKAMKNVL